MRGARRNVRHRVGGGGAKGINGRGGGAAEKHVTAFRDAQVSNAGIFLPSFTEN